MTTVTRRQLLGGALALSLSGLAVPTHAQSAGFDHQHAAWTALLRKHVRLIRGGQATQVAYAGFKADRAQLKTVLDAMSGVNPMQDPRGEIDLVFCEDCCFVFNRALDPKLRS